MVQPPFFTICFEKIEICEMCEYCTACAEFNNTRNYENDPMILNKQMENNVSMKTRIYYLRQHEQQNNILLSQQIELDITPGHCDQYFREEGKQYVQHYREKTESNNWLHLSGALVAGALLLTIMICLIIYSSYKIKSKNNDSEETDQNPDYGENYDGCEYQETAVKDVNIYYGDEDDYDDVEILDEES